jgi:hypothetical protein
MKNFEHFDEIYGNLKTEVEKARTATNPQAVSDVERISIRLMRELILTLPRLTNDTMDVCRKRRKELFEGK